MTRQATNLRIKLMFFSSALVMTVCKADVIVCQTSLICKYVEYLNSCVYAECLDYMPHIQLPQNGTDLISAVFLLHWTVRYCIGKLILTVLAHCLNHWAAEKYFFSCSLKSSNSSWTPIGHMEFSLRADGESKSSGMKSWLGSMNPKFVRCILYFGINYNFFCLMCRLVLLLERW